jgi:hypothetical protein
MPALLDLTVSPPSRGTTPDFAAPTEKAGYLNCGSFCCSILLTQPKRGGAPTKALRLKQMPPNRQNAHVPQI